jgi:hypothetical protein
MRRIRCHLTYSNVMVTILAFLVLTGGTAVALSGSNTVQSDDLGPGAQVKAPDVADNAVNSADVVNESLTGTDIKNRSGVETCRTPLTARYGRLCVGSGQIVGGGGVSGEAWFGAVDYCASVGGLRLPAPSEAAALATKYDVPGVSGTDELWTDSFFVNLNDDVASIVVDDNGVIGSVPISNASVKTVCVTDPSA